MHLLHVALIHDQSIFSEEDRLLKMLNLLNMFTTLFIFQSNGTTQGSSWYCIEVIKRWSFWKIRCRSSWSSCPQTLGNTSLWFSYLYNKLFLEFPECTGLSIADLLAKVLFLSPGKQGSKEPLRVRSRCYYQVCSCIKGKIRYACAYPGWLLCDCI